MSISQKGRMHTNPAFLYCIQDLLKSLYYPGSGNLRRVPIAILLRIIVQQGPPQPGPQPGPAGPPPIPPNPVPVIPPNLPVVQPVLIQPLPLGIGDIDGDDGDDLDEDDQEMGENNDVINQSVLNILDELNVEAESPDPVPPTTEELRNKRRNGGLHPARITHLNQDLKQPLAKQELVARGYALSVLNRITEVSVEAAKVTNRKVKIEVMCGNIGSTRVCSYYKRTFVKTILDVTRDSTNRRKYLNMKSKNHLYHDPPKFIHAFPLRSIKL